LGGGGFAATQAQNYRFSVARCIIPSGVVAPVHYPALAFVFTRRVPNTDWVIDLFGVRNPIIAMCPLHALPGDPAYDLVRAYPECGGRNSSAIHWDVVKDLRHEGTVTLDGWTVLEDGELLVG
jgi:hypothetical protein